MSSTIAEAPKKHNTRWSEADKAKLRRMVKQGMSNGQIAEELNRTKAAVEWTKCVLKHGPYIKSVKLETKKPAVKPVTKQKTVNISEVLESVKKYGLTCTIVNDTITIR